MLINIICSLLLNTYAFATDAHYHLAVTVNNARKGDELWVLLIRHLVDKKFDQGFISLHTQVEDGPQDRSRSMWTVKDYALKVRVFPLVHSYLTKPGCSLVFIGDIYE